MYSIDQGWAEELRPLRSVLWKARDTSAPKETESYRELKIPRKEVSPEKISQRARQQLRIPFITSSIMRQTSENHGQEVPKEGSDTGVNGEQRNERSRGWKMVFTNEAHGIFLAKSIRFPLFLPSFFVCKIIKDSPSSRYILYPQIPSVRVVNSEETSF